MLPDSYSVGAKKAWDKMLAEYGPEEGRRIFVQKAVERGRGVTMLEVVNDVYGTGKTLPEVRRIIDVNTNRDRPVPPTVRIVKK
jgi:hypothetical protein